MLPASRDLNLARLKDCTCGNLREATRVVTQFFDEALQPSGLRVTQFGLLATLHTSGPVTISGLAQETGLDRTTLTRNLKPLKKQGLVAILCGEDRRTREVNLTTEGESALATTMPFWEGAQVRMVQGLGEERFEALRSCLSAVKAIAR